MANPWFRMYSEFATDAKVQSMGEAMQRRLVMLFCLRCSNDIATLQDDELAFALRLSDEELAETKALFLRKGFIDDAWNLLNWEKRQFTSDSSTARSRKHREAKRKTGNNLATLRNVAATPPDTDTDTDTEEDLVPTVHSRLAAPKRPAVPVRDIVNLYHQALPMCPQVRKLTAARRTQIEARWRGGDLPDLDTWRSYFEFCAESEFLTGMAPPMNGHKVFVADLEWLTREGNYAKVYERKYHR